MSKKLFYLLLFLLPVNLGKHFIFESSFVKGLLIDYLIPTIYVQDILILTLLTLYFHEIYLLSSKSFKDFLYQIRLKFFPTRFVILYMFIFSVFFSMLTASLPLVSFISFLRLFIYLLLFVYISNEVSLKRELDRILNILLFSFSLVSLLGILQFFNKGSVFDNYLFFGEQPYSFSTKGIALENFFGYSLVPAYGLFRHPNIFGGLLSILLLINFAQIRRYGFTRVSLYVSLFLLFTALLFTFSYTAVFVLLFFMFLSLIKYLASLAFSISFFKRIAALAKKVRPLPFLYFLLFMVIIFLPILVSVFFNTSVIPVSLQRPSIYRRIYLNDSAFNMIREHSLYGVGISLYTANMESYVSYANDIRFLQPVHNVFLLIFSETGILSFTLFLIFLFFSYRNVYKMKDLFIKNLFLSVFFVLLFLFSFDHYFWTIPQSLLLFWIFLGMCWTNDHDY